MRMHTPLLMNSALFVNWPGGNFPEKGQTFCGRPSEILKKSVQILSRGDVYICARRINFSWARHNIAADCSSSSPAVLLSISIPNQMHAQRGDLRGPSSVRNISV